MQPDFRNQLNTKADYLEASFGPATTAMNARVAAHAEVIDETNKGTRAVRHAYTARRGIAAFRGRDGGSDVIVRNKHQGAPDNLPAWISASHVEKAPKPKKKEPTPQP